ncbi:MAG: PilZ domain-containing protein [Planctomycetes bacterium]|nr:PilZ domain-containing protein [Planctomycetota bacterium]
MNNVKIMNSTEPRGLLQKAVQQKTPAIVSYAGSGKMHISKVTLENLGAEILEAEISPRKDPHPMNIRIGQKMAMSIKYGYGKILFDTFIVNLMPSNSGDSGGRLILSIPKKIQIIERRNYYRVQVPQNLSVSVKLSHRKTVNHRNSTNSTHFWLAQLVDISAGGLQLVIDTKLKQTFKAGQFLTIEFCPLPYEQPLRLNTQIRNILPTANNDHLCMGLQTVSLEMSEEGREKLVRICNIVEQYNQMNLNNSKEHLSSTASI